MTELGTARSEALDGLLRALELAALGDDRFRAGGEPGRFGRTFGGQLVAQALLAACATTPGMAPSSIHACFVAGGEPAEPVTVDVRRVRDGRSMASRQIDLGQADQVLLTMLASFDAGFPAASAVGGVDPARLPSDVPALQDWVASVPEALRATSRIWVDTPPPVELRIAEPPVFLGGDQCPGPRTHWMRLPRPVGDDPLLHAALLAYASDFLLLDMAFRSHPEPFTSGRLRGTSLDHSLWFHGPVRFDRWHRYTQETVALAGERALVRGAIHDEDGALVATATQEALVRVVGATATPS